MLTHNLAFSIAVPIFVNGGDPFHHGIAAGAFAFTSHFGSDFFQKNVERFPWISKATLHSPWFKVGITVVQSSTITTAWALYRRNETSLKESSMVFATYLLFFTVFEHVLPEVSKKIDSYTRH